jgi:TolB-like protein/DNA-binding winged helix-turn-helix (wHTH) protein/tetratricopeptide (TPR) repeat protein
MSVETIHFEDFELDRRAHELRCGGSIVHLERIPFDLLNLLVERRGELVTRKEILEQIWGKDVFVDGDNGINTAVRKIRLALKEDPENPRFLRTVPGKGYRFAPEPLAEKARDAASNGGAGLPGAGNLLLRKQWTLRAALGLLVVIGIAAVLLALNVQGWRGRLLERPKPNIHALAVLPFANLSGDPEQEYFADGMTEQLITELGKMSTPHVISRQSVMQYKGSTKPLQVIARELNVDAVLEGSVERSGDRVRVIVHLDQVGPESQLWTNQYNRDIHDVLRLQDEIARTVADEIQVKLKPHEYAHLTGSRPVDPEAQDDYFRALHVRNEWSVTTNHYREQDLLGAISYFRLAIEKDPKYGPAYAGMAAAYIELGNPWSGSHPAKETLPLANAAATRAVELDPALGEAHFVLAETIELGDWNWSEAERQYKLAVELSPNYAPAHQEYGRFLQALGRNDEAMKQVAYAAELNPMDLRIREVLGLVTLASRQYDSAIAQFKELNASHPSLGDFGLGWCYREKKMYPEAIAALEREVDRRRDPVPLANLASVYGLAGRKPEAVKLIDELKERSREQYVSNAVFVEAYLGLGEKDEAMARLERAFEEHDQWMVDIKSYLAWDALRSDPRFQALVRRMNFPP